MKKWLTLLLALALLLSASALAETAPGFHAEGLPIVDEPIHLSVLAVRWGHMDDSFTQNAFFTQLEEDTNVIIDWQIEYTTDWDEQKPILLASRNLPDVIYGSNVFGDSEYSNHAEFFLPLDDLIDQYMPNLKAAFEADPDFRNICLAADGKIYTLPKNLPCRPNVGLQFFLNRDWLDRLGLEMPDTLDELTEVLRAFKNEDANGNGDPNDEIPVSFTDFGGVYTLLQHMGIMGDANATSTNSYTMDKNGVATFMPVTEEFKQGVIWLRELFAEGIIDQEAFTMDDTMRMAKQQNPEIPIVGMIYSWTPDADVPNFHEQYEVLPPVLASDGNRYAAGMTSTSRNEFAITVFCEYPEVAARWADQFYTPEASIQNFWGPIADGCIQKNDDGTYTLLEPPEGVSADDHAWDMSTRDFGPKYIPEGFSDKIILPASTSDAQKLELAKVAEEYAVPPYPTVLHTSEELDEMTMLATDIISYVETTGARWVYEGGIEEEWDDYVAQLNQMGLERLMEIRQAALDRYYGKAAE